MSAREVIFPTFYLSGFESSTFVWKGDGRRDLAAETQHREQAREDYALLRRLGIGVAREGIPWPLVDDRGVCDFGIVEPLLEAARAAQVVPIWDLCHYGYPDDLDPFSAEFGKRFVAYAEAAAEYVIARTRPPRFFTPINEITFFAFAAGEWGWAAPFGNSVGERKRLRHALCAAAIAGAKAIRRLDPGARLVHIDPLVHVVAPRDRPDLVERARRETYEDTFAAWDIIAGRRERRLGGSPELLDIVGVNCYSFGQMEYREGGPHAPLGPSDDRVEPLCDMLAFAW